MKKRLLSFAFAVCIALALVPSGLAYAAESAPLTAKGGILSTGVYHLTGNTDLTSTLVVDGEVTLDLNGYVLRGNGGQAVINVSASGDLTIKDSRPDIDYQGDLTDDGLWRWPGNGGKNISGGIIYNKGTGKGIHVSGALNMEGGVIAGCKAERGPAITGTSSAKVTITGGRIVYNRSTVADGSGAAIHSEKDHYGAGSFLKVSNAEISHNVSSSNGGAIYGYNVTLTNCTISGNKANNGAGVFVHGGGALKIDNCIISDNISQHRGGGVYISGDGSAFVGASTVDGNYAGIDGGGIYSQSAIDITGSFIKDNRAMTTETSPSYGVDRVDWGRGGGLYVKGPVKATLTNSEVTGNACMYYGGGVQVCNGAELELVSGKINNNEAVLHGAGGVHVTASATLTLTDGEISNNVAHSVGGAIHSSYSCTLNLNGGKISGNKVYGRGGGVHVNVGGNLLLKGTEISHNEAYDGDNRYAATVNEDLMTWSDVKSSGSVAGYGGGVVVDAGTCTMTAGSLHHNFAQTGGGGIAFVMINTAANTDFGQNKVVSFEFKGGTIVDNETAGNGAGIYLMENSFTETDLEERYSWTIDGNDIVDAEGEEIALADAEGNAVNIQDILAAIPFVRVSGGTIQGNIAEKDGGAAYLEENTEFYISGGDVTENEAVNGGAVYVARGEAFIYGGDISNNEASKDGGALYVNGDVTMTGGTIGGAESEGNSAGQSGGAVFITGGNFIMTSGSLTWNKATGTDSVGGGVYVLGGNVTVGVSACTGEGTNHTVDPTEKTHPIVQENSATDSGGGIAVIGSGSVTMYCGNIDKNKATNRGRGLNVYMEGGTFNYHKGSVGALKSPELVIVGGSLIDHGLTGTIKLNYHHCNESSCAHIGNLAIKEASASEGAWFNLPDGEKYWDADTGYRFFGWTFHGPEANQAKEYVRSKKDYQPLGTPLEAKGDVDGSVDDETINMYALWAPEKSGISYVGSVIDGTFTAEPLVYAAGTPGNETTYDFAIDSKKTMLYSPQKAGYSFIGWYIYQVEGQNANWAGGNDEYEPAYVSSYSGDPDSGQEGFDHTALDFTKLTFLSMEGVSGDVYALETGGTLFGDIKLIAAFEPAYSGLTIEKSIKGGIGAGDEGQVFLFRVQGDPANSSLAHIDMIVSVQGAGSVTVEELPVGSYTVTEVTDWSWRYESSSVSDGANTFNNADSIEISLENLEGAKTITFTNERVNEKWLGGDYLIRNLFKGASGGIAKIASALSGE